MTTLRPRQYRVWRCVQRCHFVIQFVPQMNDHDSAVMLFTFSGFMTKNLVPQVRSRSQPIYNLNSQNGSEAHPLLFCYRMCYERYEISQPSHTRDAFRICSYSKMHHGISLRSPLRYCSPIAIHQLRQEKSLTEQIQQNVML